jgi:hypothetical protein
MLAFLYERFSGTEFTLNDKGMEHLLKMFHVGETDVSPTVQAGVEDLRAKMAAAARAKNKRPTK